MRGEPQAWRRTEVPVPGSKLGDVLRDSHLRLAAEGGAGIVSYASSCEFRGKHVPHLVIQTEAGPVTVMVLVHERMSKPVQFDEQGYRGVIVPVSGHGSLAVLTRGSATDLGTVEHIAAASARFDRLDGSESDPDLAQQVDQPPRAGRQRRVIGLELNRYSFQPVGKGSMRRGRQIGGLVDQAIDVLHHVAQAFPGLGVRAQGLRPVPHAAWPRDRVRNSCP